MTNNLYFLDLFGDKRLIAENVLFDEAKEEIQKFLDARNYKSYYSRMFETQDGLMIDVGSHTEFFLWQGKVDFNKD